MFVCCTQEASRFLAVAHVHLSTITHPLVLCPSFHHQDHLHPHHHFHYPHPSFHFRRSAHLLVPTPLRLFPDWLHTLLASISWWHRLVSCRRSRKWHRRRRYSGSTRAGKLWYILRTLACAYCLASTFPRSTMLLLSCCHQPNWTCLIPCPIKSQRLFQSVF